MRFEPNRGQWHPGISWVADVPKEMFEQYHGSGWCRVEIGPGGEVTAFEYVDPDGEWSGMRQIAIEPLSDLPSREAPFVILAMASSHQLCVEAGSASGAVLAALKK